MQIVEAFWEKRNIGRDAWEITLDRADMVDVGKTVAALHDVRFAGTYVCVKMPVGNLKMLHALEDDGFRFLETQLYLMDYFPSDGVREMCGDAAGRISYRIVEKKAEAWERVIARVTPSMFSTDRFSLDPLFGPEVSASRYRNWMRDLMSDPRSELTVILLDGEEIAFGLDVVDGRTRHGVLGGNFPEFQNAGYGMALVAGPAGRDPGVKLRTAVSSNNPQILRMHQNCGRVIYREMYVLRKFVPDQTRKGATNG